MGERGLDVAGQRSCTKHISGLVSNIFRFGVKYSISILSDNKYK